MPIHRVTAKLKRLHHRRKNSPIKLPFPVAPSLRVAELCHAPEFEHVQPVRLKNLAEVEAYSPSILFGAAADFERLVEEASRESSEVSAIDRAIVVFTQYGAVPLNDLQRVRFWQAFGVPIFELYLGLDNALLAEECEAHDGWHIAPGVRFSLSHGELVLDGKGNNGLRTGLSATLSHDLCPCGQKRPRLLNVEPLKRSDDRYLAASA